MAKPPSSLTVPLGVYVKPGENGEMIQVGTMELEVPILFNGTTIKIDDRDLRGALLRAFRSIE